MITGGDTHIGQIQLTTSAKVRGVVQGWRCGCSNACTVYLSELRRVYVRCEVCLKPLSMVYMAKKLLVSAKK